LGFYQIVFLCEFKKLNCLHIVPFRTLLKDCNLQSCNCVNDNLWCLWKYFSRQFENNRKHWKQANC